MFKNQRHTEILEIIKNENYASVADLSERLFASQPTIRRDLDLLEKKGFVRRSHGGAILSDSKMSTPVPFRQSAHTKEKIHICQLAATLIFSESLIFADASTTVSHIAEFIPQNAKVTVVTNGLMMCRRLMENNITTIATGGRLLKYSEAFAGRRAEDAVSDFNADLMIFSASSLDEDGVISDFSEEEAILRRVMHSHSEKTAFLIDSAKRESKSAYRIFSLDEVDHVITDKPLSKNLIDRYRLTVSQQTDNAILYSRT